MQLQQFKKQFFLELSEVFPETETQSFFNLLIKFKLGLNRIEVALQPDLEINLRDILFLEKALSELKKHVPIQYIIGETEFYGLTFKVNDAVLIPRPETEELVNWIIKDANEDKSLQILDIGTGSGCIAITLAKFLTNAKVTAIDICESALEVAKENAINNNVKINFITSNILNLKELHQKFDIIVSNPPYVRELEKEQMHQNVLNNEPHLALFVENDDPLLFYNKITKLAKENLTTNGALYFEINQYLGNEMEQLLTSKQFKNIKLKKDIYDVDRMIKATL